MYKTKCVKIELLYIINNCFQFDKHCTVIQIRLSLSPFFFSCYHPTFYLPEGQISSIGKKTTLEVLLRIPRNSYRIPGKKRSLRSRGSAETCRGKAVRACWREIVLDPRALIRIKETAVVVVDPDRLS